MKWFKKKKKQGPKSNTANPIPDEIDRLNEKDVSVERIVNLDICKNFGYIPASSLPTIKELKLRPKNEIAGRLHAIKALVLWLMVSPDDLSDEKILNFIDHNQLEPFITPNEKNILKSPRNDEELRNSIGWKFENTWPLAWYFGYEQPEISGQMMTGEQMQDILANYSCSLNENMEEWAAKQSTQGEDQLILLEDLFYCIHNAVRSAQMGKETVPNGFHPVGNGGVIHERRHALTWMLSDSVAWDDTDLST